MAKDPTPHFMTPFVAGILAWAIPGAGHVYLGRTIRGVVLCVAVNGLFWAGVAFGGVYTVDRQKERWWYMAQMMAGASGALSWQRQKSAELTVLRKAEQFREAERVEGRTLSAKDAYEHVLVKDKLALTYPADVVSRAYTGIAGMLNLMCIFDAFMLAAMGRMGEPPPLKGRNEAKPGKEKAA